MRTIYRCIEFLRIAEDFAPETFGRLTTIGPAFRLPYGRQGKKATFQVCECECGSVCVQPTSDCRKGTTVSCGCFRISSVADRNKTHGMKHTAEYKTWCSMKARCDNVENPSYKSHGGRGIAYCDQWKDFTVFFVDMGTRPSAKHSLERKNNNGNYTPENCVWATKEEQANNRRSNHVITMDGKQDTLANWCRFYGMRYKVALSRINKLGWEPKDAFTKPIRKLSNNAKEKGNQEAGFQGSAHTGL